MMGPLPDPIPSLVLEDLRQAAQYLEELAVAPDTRVQAAILARRHAARLWSASQAVERLMAAVEPMVSRERQR